MTMRARLLLLLLSGVALASADLIIDDFDSKKAKDATNLVDLTFKSRLTVPWGPDLFGSNPQTSADRPFRGYGFGVVSRLHYDRKSFLPARFRDLMQGERLGPE